MDFSNNFSKETLTGIKDVDKIILSHIDDRQLIEICSLNKTYMEKVCDEHFFRDRTISKYPETIKYKDYGRVRSWKQHYLNNVKYSDLLKNYGGYSKKYKSPKLYYDTRMILLINEFDYEEWEEDWEEEREEIDELIPPEALIYAIHQNNFPLIQYIIEMGVSVQFNDNYSIKYAVRNLPLPVIKYLIDQGADVHTNNDFPLRIAQKESRVDVLEYLKSVR